MKLMEWLKALFRKERASSDVQKQTDGFIITDSQYHIHTKEKI